MAGRPPQFGRSRQLSMKSKDVVEETPFLNYVQYLCAFKDALDKSVQDIKIKSGETPFIGDSNIEWSQLECTKCSKFIEDAQEYLKHIIQCQFSEKDLYYYTKYDMCPKEADKVLAEAQEVRAATSFLVKSFYNTEDYHFKVPINSPLARFFAKGMVAYIDKMPFDLTRVIPATINVDGKTHELYFTTLNLERQREKTAMIKERCRQRKIFIKLRRKCAKCEVEVPDIVLNPEQRTEEETKLLAKALRISRTKNRPIQELIMERIEEMKQKRGNSSEKEVVEPKAAVTVSENGAVEEEPEILRARSIKNQLVSDFTNDFMKPASAKRISVKTKKTDL